MKCHQIEKLFSELCDGEIASQREAEVRGHLQSCDSCASAFEEFERALDALQGLGRRRTTPELRTAILDAVDAAAEEQSDVREDVFQRAALLAKANQLAFERRAAWRGQLMGVFVGAAAVLLVVLVRDALGREADLTDGLVTGTIAQSPKGTPILETAPMEPILVERPQLEQPQLDQQVAIETSEQPPAPEPITIDREVIRTVTEYIEVPIIVVEEKVVYRGPLFTIDTSPLAGLAHNLIAAVEESNRLRADELLAAAEPDEDEPTPIADPSAPRSDPELSRPSSSRRSHDAYVFIRREDDRVSLETRGTLAALVPMLLAQLDDEDGQVVALLERELEGIRGKAEQNSTLAARLIDTSARDAAPTTFEKLFGRDTLVTDTSFEADFTPWWAANGSLLSAAEANGEF